ncbi:MAG: 50S ribosomal protein L18Ae [Candidatus Marsarchaeota archaeon]|jgi:ribosomal protein L20A (L18A)|nr:50S ribosomal protein L18Ae [Candidatus Marsarchaeota archaeon]
MRFVVSGSIARGAGQDFSVEIEALNERHASELALARIGSSQGVRKIAIRIKDVKPAQAQDEGK